MTWLETSGSGARIGVLTITMQIRPIGLRRGRLQGQNAFCAAVVARQSARSARGGTRQQRSDEQLPQQRRLSLRRTRMLPLVTLNFLPLPPERFFLAKKWAQRDENEE